MSAELVFHFFESLLFESQGFIDPCISFLKPAFTLFKAKKQSLITSLSAS
jgi:hypothetical protein